MRQLAVAVALLFAGCNSHVAAEPSPTTAVRYTPVPEPTPTPAATAVPCPAGFTVREGLTTIRVREQLGFIPAPFDAVMATGSMTGSFALTPAGGFEPCSRFVVDVRTIRSQDTGLHPEIFNRDRAIAQLLASDRFTTAVLVPVRIDGVPAPLPERGEWRATLHSKLTIRGTERDVAWDLTTRRDGSSIDATATTAFAFDEFGIERPSQVLSLEDKIRLEVKVLAAAR